MPKLREFQMFGEFDTRLTNERLKGRDFWRLCESVVALYERNFRADISMSSAYRVTIYVRDARSGDHLKESGILLVVDVIGNCSELFTLPDSAKQIQVLEWLHSGCLEAAAQFDWPIAPFDVARQAVLEAGFVNKWVHRHKASRSDRKFRAELHCEHGLHEFRSELVIFGKNRREVARVPDLVMPPDRMIFGWDLGKLTWISDDEIEILGARGIGRRVIDVAAVTRLLN